MIFTESHFYDSMWGVTIDPQTSFQVQKCRFSYNRIFWQKYHFVTFFISHRFTEHLFWEPPASLLGEMKHLLWPMYLLSVSSTRWTNRLNFLHNSMNSRTAFCCLWCIPKSCQLISLGQMQIIPMFAYVSFEKEANSNFR